MENFQHVGLIWSQGLVWANASCCSGSFSPYLFHTSKRSMETSQGAVTPRWTLFPRTRKTVISMLSAMQIRLATFLERTSIISSLMNEFVTVRCPLAALLSGEHGHRPQVEGRKQVNSVKSRVQPGSQGSSCGARAIPAAGMSIERGRL